MACGIPYKGKKVDKKSHQASATAIIGVVLALLSSLDVSGQRISGTVSEGQSVCPDDVVQFTCITRGSNILTWHINSKSDFMPQFHPNDDIGRMVSSENDPFIFANLTGKSMENGVQVLESQLYITVSSNYPTLTLDCVHENGSKDSITLRVLVTLGMVDIISEQTRSTTGCVVRFSWTLPSNVTIDDLSHFMIFLNGEHIGNRTVVNTSLATKTHPVCTCGTHNISIIAVNRCGLMSNNDHNINDPEQQPDPMCDNDEANLEMNSAGGNGALIVVIVLLCITSLFLLGVLVVLILTCCGVIPIICRPKNCGRKRKDGKTIGRDTKYSKKDDTKLSDADYHEKLSYK